MSSFVSVVNHPNNIIYFTLVGNPTESVFESEFLRPLDALIANQQPFALVVDATHVTGVAMTVALSMVKWMRHHRAELGLWLRASGVILVNKAVKAIMEFVLSVQPPVAPMLIADTPHEAWNFVSGHSKRSKHSTSSTSATLH